MSVDEKSGYNFLSSFKEIANDLDSKRFTVNYTFFFGRCEECKQETIKVNCLDTAGKYCMFNLEGGAKTMKLILLHRCALTNQHIKSNYMAFAERYSEDCLGKNLLSDDLYKCAVTTFKPFSMSTFNRVEECILDNEGDFQALKDNSDFLKETKITEAPLAIVNNKTIDGGFKIDNVF